MYIKNKKRVKKKASLCYNYNLKYNSIIPIFLIFMNYVNTFRLKFVAFFFFFLVS